MTDVLTKAKLNAIQCVVLPASVLVFGVYHVCKLLPAHIMGRHKIMGSKSVIEEDATIHNTCENYWAGY